MLSITLPTQAVKMTPAEVLFRNDRGPGRVFVLPSWKLATASCAMGLLLLAGAGLLGIGSIPVKVGNSLSDRGYFWSLNWSLIYPVVAPFLLWAAAEMTVRMTNCVEKLWQGGRIQRSDQQEGRSYPEALADFLAVRTKRLTIFSLVLAILVVLVDTKELWPSFFTGQVPFNRKPEWDTAFNASNWPNWQVQALSYRPPAPWLNFLFDFLAYATEIALLFLAFYWIGKFVQYLVAFDKLLGGQESEFLFSPDTDDLTFRMGLRPMGGIFDTFLAITAVIQGYAFYERLHLIWLNSNKPLSDYLQKLFASGPEGWPSPIKEILGLFTQENLAFHLIARSSFIALVLMTLPTIAVCFLPLWRIRKLVENVRDSEMVKLQADYREARQTNNLELIQIVQHRMEYLKKANVWPNGDARAKGYLRLIFALALGAIAPPFFALIIVFVGADIVKGLMKPKSADA